MSQKQLQNVIEIMLQKPQEKKQVIQTPDVWDIGCCLSNDLWHSQQNVKFPSKQTHYFSLYL